MTAIYFTFGCRRNIRHDPTGSAVNLESMTRKARSPSSKLSFPRRKHGGFIVKQADRGSLLRRLKLRRFGVSMDLAAGFRQDETQAYQCTLNMVEGVAIETRQLYFGWMVSGRS